MLRFGTVLAGLVLLLGASSAMAQESYCYNATAPQQAKVVKAIDRKNATTCTRLALAVGCTQAQACTAANTPGGAACTPAQALAANVRIFDGTTQPGRQEFVNELTKIGFQSADNGIIAVDNTAWCQKFKAASQAQKDSSCTAVGYVAGCEPCP
jgi:hypothetical protein